MGFPPNIIVLIVCVNPEGPAHVQMLIREYLTIENLPACGRGGGGGGGVIPMGMHMCRRNWDGYVWQVI